MRIFLFVTIVLLSGCFTTSHCQDNAGADSTIAYLEEDLEILEEIFSEFGQFLGPTSDLMLMLGGYFAKSPYVEQSLEHEPETLVVNLREFDCTTFVESCLAIARTIRSEDHNFQQFTSELKNIRYHKGIIDGYPSRIHYFSDWIYLNHQKQITRDVSREIGGSPFSKEINFMSTHPASYQQLSSDSSFVEIIARQEHEISSRQLYYLPKDRLAEFESDLRDGDIVGITTSVKGLDISHAGILVRKSDHVHLLHASSMHRMVILSEETLEDYLANNKSGIWMLQCTSLCKQPLIRIWYGYN